MSQYSRETETCGFCVCHSQSVCSDYCDPRSFFKPFYFIRLRQEWPISSSDDLFGCTRQKGKRKNKSNGVKTRILRAFIVRSAHLHFTSAVNLKDIRKSPEEQVAEVFYFIGFMETREIIIWHVRDLKLFYFINIYTAVTVLGTILGTFEILNHLLR